MRGWLALKVQVAIFRSPRRLKRLACSQKLSNSHGYSMPDFNFKGSNAEKSVNGRSAGIRTPGLLLPKQALYQAELHSDAFRRRHCFTLFSESFKPELSIEKA